MRWEDNLEHKYYFSESELIVNFSTMTEAVLGMAIWIIYELVMWQLINVFVGIMIELFFAYFWICCYKVYKKRKVKIWIDSNAIIINSLYRIKPWIISKESIDNVEIIEKRRKKVLRIVTKEKTYKVMIYKW